MEKKVNDADNDPHDCDHRLALLRASQEQVKARVATDVIRLVDRGDGPREAALYDLAVDYLTTYFGGAVDGPNHDGYG